MTGAGWAQAFAMVASLAIMGPIVGVLNEMFLHSFWTVQANAHTGVFKVLGGILMYVTVVYATITFIMALPQSMPDRILRWIGAGIGDMGEQHSMSDIKGGQSQLVRGALLQGNLFAEGMGRKQNAAADKVLQTKQADFAEKQYHATVENTAALKNLPAGGGGGRSDK